MTHNVITKDAFHPTLHKAISIPILNHSQTYHIVDDQDNNMQFRKRYLKAFV